MIVWRSNTMLKRDTVENIIAFEAGELSEEEVIDFFKELTDSGLINSLQGSYQRVAVQLKDEGLI